MSELKKPKREDYATAAEHLYWMAAYERACKEIAMEALRQIVGRESEYTESEVFIAREALAKIEASEK